MQTRLRAHCMLAVLSAAALLAVASAASHSSGGSLEWAAISYPKDKEQVSRWCAGTWDGKA